MFTGLVQKVGTLVARRPGVERQTLVIAARLDPRDRVLGASVAVDGVCLTITEASDEEFSVDAAFETLRLTTLASLAAGRRVNLEPALRVGDPLGGHLVSGHVDGIGHVRSVTPHGDAREVFIDAPATLLAFVAPKGSIAVDGTSLTVNAVDARGFAVGLVPHTLTATTLGELASGRAVNLEVDLVARYVARLMGYGGATAETLPGVAPSETSGLSVDALVEAGYLDPGDGRR